jgi:hypothetical protein
MSDYAYLKARLRTLNLRVSTSLNVPVRDLYLGSSFTDATTAIEALEERVRVLSEALRPFAKAGELFPDRAPDEHWDQSIYRPAAGPDYEIAGDDLRSARTTLNQESPDAGR